MNTNPLLAPHSLPPFHKIQAEHVAPAIEAILSANRAVIANLNATDVTWASVPAVLECLQDRLDQAWSPVSHFNAVMNSETWRSAYNNALPKLSAYATELGQNETLFKAYESLANADGFTQMSQAQQNAILHALRDFRLSGIGLAPEKKQRYADIMATLAELTSAFADNVLDATQAWELLLPDASRLQGLPDTTLALLSALATQKELSGYRITLDHPSYVGVMTYASDRALREAVYIAYVTRASDQGPMAGQFDNSSRLTDILRLRQEEAQLLGYANFAEVSLVPKMASNPQAVLDFLNDLAQRARAGAEKELAELRDFAASELNIIDLQSWDVAFASEKLKEKRYAISQEIIRPYFPANTVIQGMLHISERLFGIEIREILNAERWHDDVTYYEISENNSVIASFYLDPYARANKRGGAWMADCRVRRHGNDGVMQKPVAFLTCNFNPPLDGKPALLSHDEVITLFHEFGHGLQHMLTRIDVAAVSGINGVAWDAVELPSQFFENWCWQADALALISGHVDTGAPLPAELLQKMLAAKNFQSGLMMLRQVEFSLFDMELHAASEVSPTLAQSVLDNVRQRVAVFIPPACSRFQNSFSHIFAGGYAAGYYSYKWAEVLSADAFSCFEEEGVMNPEAGQRFRETVLAEGGSRPAKDIFIAFRGREPNVAALLRQTGLAA